MIPSRLTISYLPDNSHCHNGMIDCPSNEPSDFSIVDFDFRTDLPEIDGLHVSAIFMTSSIQLGSGLMV